jgi:hypothetical protein
VEQQNVEKVQVEATHRGRITELEEELALTWMPLQM